MRISDWRSDVCSSDLAAVSGLVAAFIVAVSRAIGETMVVFIAAGATGGSLFTLDPLASGQTMTAALASQASRTAQVRGAALTFQDRKCFRVGNECVRPGRSRWGADN